MITSPLRPRDQRQESGIAAGGRLAHPRNALRRFTFVRHHDASMASFRPALTEAPQRQTGRTGTARSIPSRALAIDVGFPLSGSSTGLPPPISTSVPGTPPLAYGSLRGTDRYPRYPGQVTIHRLSRAMDRQTGSGHPDGPCRTSRIVTRDGGSATRGGRSRSARV